MSGKLISIGSATVKIDSFEVTDRESRVSFSITRTADSGGSTGAVVGLFSDPSLPVAIVDSDSNVAFKVTEPKIADYKYFTRDGSPALEYFKIEGVQITAKSLNS